MTNFEKLKTMSIDELADKLDEVFACEYCPIAEFCNKNEKIKKCKSIWKKWLKSEEVEKKELKSKRVEKILTTEEELEKELIRIEIQNMIRSLSVPGKYYSIREPGANNGYQPLTGSSTPPHPPKTGSNATKAQKPRH